MPSSHLSLTYRASLLANGLLTESQARDLISEALASNMMMYLPKELGAIALELIRRKEISIPES